MAITAQEVEKALMPKKPKKKGNDEAYKSWQDNAAAGYGNLINLGLKIVKEYFKSNAIGVCRSAPWGKLPPDKNIFRESWEAFVKEVLTTKTLKEKDHVKQVKDSIYMGSQEVWLDEEAKKDKDLKTDLSTLTNEMKFRLTLLKNGDQKKQFLVGFFGDKRQKKTFSAFIQALNLNYWSHRKCTTLLRKITSLEAQLAELKKRKPIAKPEKKISWPDKPSLSAAINMIKHAQLREMVENEAYVKYMSNPLHFKKLTHEQREELLSEINYWKTLAEYSPKALPTLEMFHHILKASANL